MKERPATTDPRSASTQLAGFLAKFDPQVARLARDCRAAVRKRLPAAHELVYDNYQFLAIGYSASERASDCLVSLAVSSKGVALSFYYGASLPDPDGILLGSGTQNRFVPLAGAAQNGLAGRAGAAALGAGAVEALLRAATAKADTPLPSRGRGTLTIKSVS